MTVALPGGRITGNTRGPAIKAGPLFLFGLFSGEIISER